MQGDGGRQRHEGPSCAQPLQAAGRPRLGRATILAAHLRQLEERRSRHCFSRNSADSGRAALGRAAARRHSARSRLSQAMQHRENRRRRPVRPHETLGQARRRRRVPRGDTRSHHAERVGDRSGAAGKRRVDRTAGNRVRAARKRSAAAARLARKIPVPTRRSARAFFRRFILDEAPLLPASWRAVHAIKPFPQCNLSEEMGLQRQ